MKARPIEKRWCDGEDLEMSVILFTGEWATCGNCGKQKKLEIGVESGWYAIDLEFADGSSYRLYYCPGCLTINQAIAN